MKIINKSITKHNNSEILLVELESDNGMKASITNLGCAVTSLIVNDKNNKPIDVVLGYDNIEEYFNNPPFLGVVVGPFANRIKNGQFEIDNKSFEIEKNEGKNSLHSGSITFSRRVWNLENINQDKNYVSVTFSITNIDGNGGFPGDITVYVKYTLTNSNKLVVTYKAKSDKKTIINLTQHSYFNLNGAESNTLDHNIYVNSDKYVEVDTENIPTGEFKSVDSSVFDLRKTTPISDSLKEIPRGYDHCFVLNKKTILDSPAATLSSPSSGIKLDMFTSEPGVQVYASGFLPEINGKNNKEYKAFDGVCLEAQHYPDSPNHKNFPSVILEPGKEYLQTTIFRFSNL